MNIIDLNIGLAISTSQNLLALTHVDTQLVALGLPPKQSRLAQSATEITYVVRCSIEPGGLTLAERVHQLALALKQDCIAAVPHDGTPAICVGPRAHRWGGAFLPQHWISLA